MNVTVFGATGAIGSLTVAELLDRGHTVTAYARNTAKIPSIWGDRVRVIIGEMSDAAAIDSAVSGADAVVSALGEIRGMTDPVKVSDLDWTIVRFIRPTNGPKQGRVRAGFFGTDRPGFSISRTDIAAFTAAQVDDDTYLRRAPAVSSGKGGSTGPA